MADIASIIANIDGYRTYEQNRALDLQNQAAKMVNAQNEQIWDLKRALAQNTPDLFGKLSYLDPQSARQKQLSDQEQLKMASKWANSIKNLAPENRERGYGQFLKAMRGYGIDVSDMPQAYDEGYVNQMAELGIEPETRYTNEQVNARLERQIDAQREARQDEFNKKLQAFDYENNYRTKAENDKLAEIDNLINSSSLSDEDKERARLAYRNISLPNARGQDELMLERLTVNPQDEIARTYFANKAEANKFINGLIPIEKVAFKDAMHGLKYAKESGATVEALNDTSAKMGYPELQFENLSDADKFIKNVETLKQKYPNMSDDELIKIAGKETYTGAAYGEGLKAGAKAAAEQPYLIERDNNQSQNRINENIIGQNVADKIKQGQMILQADIDKDFEKFKKDLPVDSVVQADQIAQRLQQQGHNITSTDILKNQYEKDVLENLQKQANIAQTQANTNKTNAETPFVGMTDAMKNDQYLRDNPERANSPVFDKAKTDKGERELRKEFNALTKDYRTIGDSYSRILQAAERKSAAGDLSLIFNYMKMLDPNSVVRESEFSNAENARAWFDESGAPTAIKLAYNKAKNGQRLLDEQRKDFVDMADLLMRAQKQSFEALGNRYKEIAEEAGYNPDNVVIDPYANSINEIMENPVIDVGGSKEYNNGFKIERVD